MIENITIGQISVAIAFIVAFVGGVKYILSDIKKIMDKSLKPTNDKIDALETNLTKQIKNTDLNATKNFLVARIEELKNNDDIADSTRQRVYEEYSHYLELGGNGFIQAEIDALKREGKL